MEYSSIIVPIVTAIFGGGIGVFFSFRINSRKQNVDEYQFLLDERKEITTALSKRIDLLEEEVKDLRKKDFESKQEISLLRNQLILFEGSHTDIPLPMWLKDTNGKMLYLNKPYEEMFLLPRNYTAEDYIGNDDYSVWSDEIAAGFITFDKAVVRTKKHTRRIETIENSNGDLYYALVLKYPRKINDKVIGISGIILRTSNNKQDLK